jgi:hypothetical protein
MGRKKPGRRDCQVKFKLIHMNQTRIIAAAGNDSGDDVLLADVALREVLDGHAGGMGQLVEMK